MTTAEIIKRTTDLIRRAEDAVRRSGQTMAPKPKPTARTISAPANKP